MINPVLVDARNFKQLENVIANEIVNSDFIGLDCETEDTKRHDGINRYCGYAEPEGKKSGNKKLVFDHRRMVCTGQSIYCNGSENAYYFNLAHSDVENRIPWQPVKELYDLRPTDTPFICHNLEFEQTVFQNCFEYGLPNSICTLQMAVSAYNPDEYSKSSFRQAGTGGISTLLPNLRKQAIKTRFASTKKMTPELETVIQQILAKQSKAKHSYNGYVKEIAYGYALKQAVKSHFDFDMTTFEEVLGDCTHMGQLTGEQVVSYGADDAYWAVRLFFFLLDYMAVNCPDTINTFFEQENPMVPIYSSIHCDGWRVNEKKIDEYRETERANMATTLRELKTHVKSLLPFGDKPNEALAGHEKWYEKNHQKYRANITQWANTPDQDQDYDECMLVRGPVAKSWSKEKGDPESTGPNFSHYMPIRVLMYDLIGADIIWLHGKVQSDGEARGRLKDKIKDATAKGIMDCLNKIAGVEQRMKLYISPYTDLMDPETQRLYPLVSSELATRRMAASFPNPMQLAKRGEGTPVRGFFLPDNDEHVLVSIDWSSFELVIVGEASGDPEFIKAYGQTPYQDLHAGSAADILQVEIPEMTEELFRSLRGASEWPQIENLARLQTNVKGEPIPIEKVYGYWRTEIGKGANFNYWYSGWLATIGERMGWDMETISKATEKYRERFWVAEQWRTNLISTVQRQGFVELPDHHRRVRYEATDDWFMSFCLKFLMDGQDDYNAVIRHIASKIQKRAFNQAVNAFVQGTNATAAKRPFEN